MTPVGEQTDAGVWVIRPGTGGWHTDDWLNQGVATVGFIGALPVEHIADEDLQDYVRSSGRGSGEAKQIFDFRVRLQVGDLLLAPGERSERFLLGRVTGDYRWSSSPVVADHHQVRTVDWAGPFDAADLGGDRDVLRRRWTLQPVADDATRNRLLAFAAVHLGAAVPTRSSSSGRLLSVGVKYEPVAEDRNIAPRDPFEVDPEAIDRGNRGHWTTQNRLAAWVTEQGWEPSDPAAGEPLYDLAWETSDCVFVAEVKSLTVANAESQLRLGLGQVLRYRHALAGRSGMPVQGVLAVEHAIFDSSWHAVCRGVGITLVTPDTFEDILSAAEVDHPSSA